MDEHRKPHYIWLVIAILMFAVLYSLLLHYLPRRGQNAPQAARQVNVRSLVPSEQECDDACEQLAIRSSNDPNLICASAHCAELYPHLCPCPDLPEFDIDQEGVTLTLRSRSTYPTQKFNRAVPYIDPTHYPDHRDYCFVMFYCTFTDIDGWAPTPARSYEMLFFDVELLGARAISAAGGCEGYSAEKIYGTLNYIPADDEKNGAAACVFRAWYNTGDHSNCLTSYNFLLNYTATAQIRFQRVPGKAVVPDWAGPGHPLRPGFPLWFRDWSSTYWRYGHASPGVGYMIYHVTGDDHYLGFGYPFVAALQQSFTFVSSKDPIGYGNNLVLYAGLSDSIRNAAGISTMRKMYENGQNLCSQSRASLSSSKEKTLEFHAATDGVPSLLLKSANAFSGPTFGSYIYISGTGKAKFWLCNSGGGYGVKNNDITKNIVFEPVLPFAAPFYIEEGLE